MSTRGKSLWGRSNPFSNLSKRKDEDVDTTIQSLENYSTRLKSVGVDPEEVTDGRNPVQKALGLREGTGIIGGFFDLLNRPQQALFGTIQEPTNRVEQLTQSEFDKLNPLERQAYRDQVESVGKSALERMASGFMDGLTGKKRYTGGQIIRNLFEEGRKEDGKFDASDVFGTFLDMTLDPVQLALFATTGGAGNVATAGAKGLAAADKVSDFASVASKIDDLAMGAQKLKKGAEAVSDFQKATATAKQFAKASSATVNEAVKAKESFSLLKQVGKGLNTVGKATDINNYLFTKKWRDTHTSFSNIIFNQIGKGLKAGGRLTKSAYEQAFDIYHRNNPQKAEALSQSINELSSSFKRIFTRKDTDVLNLSKMNREKLSQATQEFDKMLYPYMTNLDEIASSGVLSDIGETTDDIAKAVFQYYEFANLEPSQLDAVSFFDKVINGRGVDKIFPYSDELYNSLRKLSPRDLSEIGISIVENSNGSFIQFNSDFWNKNNFTKRSDLDAIFKAKTSKSVLEDILENKGKVRDWSEEVINFGSGRTQEELARFNEWAKNPHFLAEVNNLEQIINSVQDTIGVKFFDDANAVISKSMKGYIPHTINPEIVQGLQEIGAEVIEREGGLENVFNQFNDLTGTPTNLVQSSGGLSALTARRHQMSASEFNRVAKEYYSQAFQKEDWVKFMFNDLDSEAVEQVRELLTNTDWFIEDSRIGIYDLMTSKTRAIANSKRKTDILLRATFDGRVEGRAGLTPINIGDTVPAGAEILSNAEIKNLKNSLLNTKVYGDNPYLDSLISQLDSAISGSTQIALDKHLRKFVGTITKTDANVLLDNYQRTINYIRSNKLLSPTYNIINVTGNLGNMWLSGIPLGDSLIYTSEASNLMKQFRDGGEIANIVAERGIEALDEATQAKYRLYREMKELGVVGSNTYAERFGVDNLYKGIDEGLSVEQIQQQLTKTTQKARSPIARVRQLNMDANQNMDEVMRYAIGLYAQDNPNYIANLGVDSAINASRLVMFDPNDLTLMENQLFKRMSMFYSFARQNIAYHLKNLTKNTDRYYRMDRFKDSLWDGVGIPEEDRNTFDTGFVLPSIGTLINGRDEEGSYGVARIGTPFDDFVEFTERPVSTYLNSLTPALKAPIEIGTNRRLWDGSEVQGDMFQYTLEQLGYDVPVKYAQRGLEAIARLAQGDLDGAQESLGRFTGLGARRNIESNRRSQRYEDIQKISDFIAKKKKEGNPIPTLAELQEAGLIRKKRRR